VSAIIWTAVPGYEQSNFPYGAGHWQDFEHFELNTVGGGKPADDESSVLCPDMHAKYV